MKEKKPNVGPINAAVCGPTPTIEPEAFMRPFLAQIREIPFVSIWIQTSSVMTNESTIHQQNRRVVYTNNLHDRFQKKLQTLNTKLCPCTSVMHSILPMLKSLNFENYQLPRWRKYTKQPIWWFTSWGRYFGIFDCFATIKIEFGYWPVMWLKKCVENDSKETLQEDTMLV